MATLLLTLAAPLQSWGTTSRFDERTTGREPSKSGVLGMIAAAQGRGRDTDVSDLASLRMGVRCDLPGRALVDYHTAGGVGGVAVASGGRPRTVVTRRIYLQDAAFVVGLEGDVSVLEAVNEALRAPRWPLGLGRRSCPPMPPVHSPEGLLDVDLETALRAQPWPWSGRVRGSDEIELVIEDPHGDETVLDAPTATGFATRTFAPRRLRRESITLPSEATR